MESEVELELDLGRGLRGLRGALEVSEAEQPGWMESMRLELARPPAWLGGVRARVPVKAAKARAALILKK